MPVKYTSNLRLKIIQGDFNKREDLFGYFRSNIRVKQHFSVVEGSADPLLFRKKDQRLNNAMLNQTLYHHQFGAENRTAGGATDGVV